MLQVQNSLNMMVFVYIIVLCRLGHGFQAALVEQVVAVLCKQLHIKFESLSIGKDNQQDY